MANLKSLKTRIKSVKSTQKMTKAMKMVAASRLKKAKHSVESSRPYSDKIQQVTSNIASNVSIKGNLNEKFPLLTGKGKDETRLLVVVSSDRGLCGGINSATVKFVKHRINDLVAQGKNIKIFCVGRKAYDQLRIIYSRQIIEKSFGVFKGIVNYQTAQDVAIKITSLFDANEFDVCEVIYSKFKSAISQEQLSKQLIPASINIDESYISSVSFEPNEEEVLSDLLEKNLTMQIYNCLLENSASEQGARMAAMEAATNNAGKMIKNLTLIYNRTRQANITKELIDIISGANVA